MSSKISANNVVIYENIIFSGEGVCHALYVKQHALFDVCCQ